MVNEMVPSLQHGVLSKEFVELMGYCNTIQAQYRDRNVERIQRQLKISEYMKHGCVSSGLLQGRSSVVLITSPCSACWTVGCIITSCLMTSVSHVASFLCLTL